MELTKILLVCILIVAVLSLGVLITKPVEIEKPGYGYSEYGDFRILSEGEDEESKYLIDVNGDAKISADPEKVEVYLGAETRASTAKKSQQDNANIMDAVRTSLKLIGTSSDDIETTQYTLTIVKHWDKDTEKYVITGYKTTHVIKIESTDIDKAGDIIDKSVQSGANIVDNVVFSLTDDKINEMRLDALRKAGLNAKEKAEAVADSLGVSIKGLYRASESYVYYTPYVQRGYEMAVVEAGVAPTEISPGQIEVSASLSVSYEFV